MRTYKCLFYYHFFISCIFIYPYFQSTAWVVSSCTTSSTSCSRLEFPSTSSPGAPSDVICCSAASFQSTLTYFAFVFFYWYCQSITFLLTVWMSKVLHFSTLLTCLELSMLPLVRASIFHLPPQPIHFHFRPILLFVLCLEEPTFLCVHRVAQLLLKYR